MQKFEFRGVIHPTRIRLNYGPVSSPFVAAETGMTGRIAFEISDGKVVAQLESEEAPDRYGLVFMGCLSEVVLLGIYPYLDVAS